MIPTLNMNDIRRHTAMAVSLVDDSAKRGLNSSHCDSGGAPLATGPQISPRNSYVTSPGEASSLPSAHLTRRAADVSGLLEMNPLQCHSVIDLQRKLIETAEWVVQLRHWYAHQLQERDVWFESRLKSLGDSYHAVLAGFTAAPKAHSKTGTGAATPRPLTGSSFTEHAAPSTASASRIGAGKATLGSVVPATVSAPKKGKTGGVTPLRASSCSHKNSTASGAEAGSSNCNTPRSSNLYPSALLGMGGATVGSGNTGPEGGSSTPLRTCPPRQSVFVPVAQSRRTASAVAPQRELLHTEDGEIRRAGAVVSEPIIVDIDEDASETPPCQLTLQQPRGNVPGRISLASSLTYAQVISTPTGPAVVSRRDPQSLSTPRSGRPSSARASLSAPRSATESLGRFPGRAKGIGGRKGDTTHSARKRYYTAVSRSKPGGINTSLPHHAQYLGADTSPDAAVAARASTGNDTADSATSEPHDKVPQVNTYFGFMRDGVGVGDDVDVRNRIPKRRSVSSGGNYRSSRMYITSSGNPNAARRTIFDRNYKGTRSSAACVQRSPNPSVGEQSLV
ncbi:hypothetical protein JKF63_07114 [Porcisia hertigi]|uniref:Uncharacterized protein n=1 Tax=Porcisia hertigi TaxID=2761500 RepID=A0A836YJE0_9TRYP|nr:hypothetical protein JKF63_07114 [Porcisia hertigi]